MDQLFIGMLNSKYEESFKRAFIEQIVVSATNKAISSEECVSVLKESFIIAVTAEKPLACQMGERVYLAWAQHHENELALFLHPYLIQRLMTPGVCQNKAMLLNLLNESLKILKRLGSDLLYELLLIIQSSCLNFLTEDDTLGTVKALVCLLLTHKDCIPCKDSLGDMGMIILKIISQAEIPNILGKQSPLVNDIQIISLLYKEINLKLGGGYFLSLLYVVFVFLTQSILEPSIAVGGLVESLNLVSTPEIISQLMSDEMFKSTAFNTLLQRLIDGLLWPVNTVISGWILSIMKELTIAGRFSLLIEVSQAKIKQILDILTYGEDKNGTLLVFKYILLSYQHSPDVFHKIVEFIPSTLTELEARLLPEEKNVLYDISEVLHTVMYHHAGFPQLYDPLLLAIQPFPKPSNERMNQLINENRWLPAKCGYATYHPSCLSRSVTGKIGLINLGNTCYMNCVVQALFSTYEFSTAVLSSQPSAEQETLSNLQKLFAYLAHSQRVAVEASEFFESSCPPWFISNHQQDCSEYLRYLLDLLHEQENSKIQNSKSKNYEEINSSSLNKKSAVKGQSLKSMPDSRPTTSHTENNKTTQSLVRSKFAGQLVSSYQCLKCGHISDHPEVFIDLHLAFPENYKSVETSSAVKIRTEMRQNARKLVYDKIFLNESTRTNRLEDISSQPENQQARISENLNLQTMLRKYFEMEKLEGENKYQCENCNNLTDAVRSIRITKSPKHLILTLLRFSYDFQTQKRSKIQTNVHYPLKLTLPVCTTSLCKGKCDLNPSVNEQIECNEHLYYLYAVIIHSGISSESGHYYTYARPVNPIPFGDNKSMEESDDSNEQWYLFNDSSVSFCTPSSFRTVTQRFPKDTAYVLFYRRVSAELLHDPKLVVLKKELREEIDKDNLQYLKEEEERLLRLKRCSPRIKYKKFDDDNHPPGSCGGGGFGFSLNNIPRFVS